jgi:hypothetical protein
MNEYQPAEVRKRVAEGCASLAAGDSGEDGREQELSGKTPPLRLSIRPGRTLFGSMA